MPLSGLRVKRKSERAAAFFGWLSARKTSSTLGRVNFRNGFYAGAVVAVIWAIYLVRLWQPQRQIELHNAHLLEQIEQKNWKRVEGFLAADYSDRWGHDRTRLLERLREVFRVLSSPQIEASETTVRLENGRGYWTARIRLKASGEFADYVQGRVNSVESPFTLEWQRGATWPWDWKLVATQNPDVEIQEFSP